MKTFRSPVTTCIGLQYIVFAFALMSLAVPLAVAQSGGVLYTFTGGSDGNYSPGLISDAAGNLYGVTQAGGNLSDCSGVGCGVVFKLSPTTRGEWMETVLYTFTGGEDGEFPASALALDMAGNLFGITPNGRLNGHGVVFELSPTMDGSWKETVLYSFTGGVDGGTPWAGLVFDGAGNLYGAAEVGGNLDRCPRNHGCGVIFELSPGSNGSWQYNVLYAFPGGGKGLAPLASLVFDAAGNLYGTAVEGGDYRNCQAGCGVVFELSPTSGGSWSETVLHAFTGGKDGGYLTSGVVIDSAGNLYGCTQSGGEMGWGVVFKLSRDSNNEWKEGILHAFTDGADGAFPEGGSVLDAQGNLYGTAYIGGNISDNCAPSGCGVAFKLSPTSNGKWKERVLHAFTAGNDGFAPANGLMFGQDGNLYGTSQGGVDDAGVIFTIKQ